MNFDNLESASVNQTQSFNDYCKFDNNEEQNDFDNIKADNFNLRLRCYNLEEALNKLKHPNKGNIKSCLDNHDKLDQFLNVNSNLLEENKVLKDENMILKEKLEYFIDCKEKYAEFDSIRKTCEQMKQLLAKKGIDEVYWKLLESHDESERRNVVSNQVIFDLKKKEKELKKVCLTNEYHSKQSTVNYSQFKSKLVRNFTESLDISRNISGGCHECNALKVNINKLEEFLMKNIYNNENLLSSLALKDTQIKELENLLESARTEPIVSKERLNKYGNLIQDLTNSVIKKDKKLQQLTDENKEIINNYTNQICRKDVTIQKQIKDQHVAIGTICGLLLEIITTSPTLTSKLNQLVALTDDSKEKNTDEMWSKLIVIMREVCQVLTVPVKQTNRTTRMEDLTLSGGNAQDFITNVNKLKELSEVIFESRQESYLSKDNDPDLYSPQYKIGNDRKKPTNVNRSTSDKFSSIYLANDSFNATAYQSFDEDQNLSKMFDSQTVEAFLNRIGELADIIHQLTEVVRDDVSFSEEVSLVKLDKSCSALSLDNSRLVHGKNEQSFSNMSSLSNNASKADNNSFMKYEEYENMLMNKQEIIDTLSADLKKTKQENGENLMKIENLKIEIREIKTNYKTAYNHLDKANRENLVHMEALDLEIRQVSTNYKTACDRIDTLENYINQYEEQIKIDQANINELEKQIAVLEEEHQTENMVQNDIITDVRKHLNESIVKVGSLERNLANAEQLISKHETVLVELQSENKSLVDEVKSLSKEISIVNSEKQVLESDYQDVHASLINMTESFGIITNENEMMVDRVRKTYDRLVILSIKDNVEQVDGFTMLGEIDNYVAQLDLNDKIDGCDRPENQHIADIEQADITHRQFNDLTNVSSFRTEILEDTVANENKSDTPFKIRSLKDIIENPQKVLDMIKDCLQTIDDFKRRLRMRYKENQDLRRLVNAAYGKEIFGDLAKQVEELKIEVATDKTKVEKVMKRISRK